MAGAFFVTQWNTDQVWLLIDSGKPIPNDMLEFTFEDVRHTLNSYDNACAGTPCRFTVLIINPPAGHSFH
jgi:hypothetical protein